MGNRPGNSESAEGSSNYERDICKICMDATIDCVLLNCGHLVACAKCGKRLCECPICRAMVVRVVHIFRVWSCYVCLQTEVLEFSQK